MKPAEAASELTWTYFSFRGRITRSRFWWSNVGLNVVQFILQFALGLPQAFFAGGMDGSEPSPQRALGFLVITAAAIYPAAAIIVKRGHDRNRPAWLILSIFLGSLLGQVGASFFAPALSTVILLAFYAYVVIDLLFLPSGKGENRFGPAPRHRLEHAGPPVVLQG